MSSVKDNVQSWGHLSINLKTFQHCSKWPLTKIVRPLLASLLQILQTVLQWSLIVLSRLYTNDQQPNIRFTGILLVNNKEATKLNFWPREITRETPFNLWCSCSKQTKKGGGEEIIISLIMSHQLEVIIPLSPLFTSVPPYTSEIYKPHKLSIAFKMLQW